MAAVRPLVTDELPDRVLFRPLARGVVRLLAPTAVTANQVTFVAAIFGIASGVALGFGNGSIFAALMGTMLVLDCADGELSRLRGGGGVWGRIVDGIGDYLTGISAHVGLIFCLVLHLGVVPGLVWGLGTGISAAWRAHLLDKYKRRYRGDVDDLDAIREERDRSTGMRRFFLSGFLPYAGGISSGPDIPDRDAYRARVRFPMTIWLTVGPTTHLTVAALFTALGRPVLFAYVACIAFPAVALVNLAIQRVLERRAPAVVGAKAPVQAS